MRPFFRRTSRAADAPGVSSAGGSMPAVAGRRGKTPLPLGAALTALDSSFIVADLETTGLSTATCEILEFAAVRVNAAGGIEREFTQVVRTQGPVPSFITRLTGITQAEVDNAGIPGRDAFMAFLGFLEDLPVFFHNASFDKRFVNAAAVQTGLPYANATHCTLALARRAWPELPTHKLDALARHVGASQPTHRALADVRTTVTVALAAKARLRAFAGVSDS